MRKNIAVIMVIIVLVFVSVLAVLATLPLEGQKAMVSNFEQCAAAGYPIMESYPEQCKTPDGQTFVRTIDQVPHAQQAPFDTSATVVKDQQITFSDGLAVTLLQINDSRCKQGVVCVWAGELSYQFKAIGGGFGANGQEFTLATTTGKANTLNGYKFELKSGTETSATIVVAKQAAQPLGACYIGGCSSQLCTDQQGAVSTCEYREAYACYKNAVCERQADGQCGWTQTPQLQACLTSTR